jgi:ketosteroid isomerase-like protein
MGDEASRAPARDPQDLERLLVERQWAADLDGMVALYEPEAVIDAGDGQVLHGLDAIAALFAGIIASGRKFQRGVQRPAVVSGDLALTSTGLADGSVTSEVARRQADGTWLWVIDKFSVT